VLYFQQSLAKLGYLPLQWTASSDTKTTVNPRPPYTPENGKWTWSFANTPATLKAQWASSVYNQLTKGAVMTFQEVNHLAIDGVTGPKTWAALTAALKQHKRNPWGYSYVYVSQGRPETMRIWKGGRYVFFSYVNTGIPSSPTPYGTWPIYIRYTSQTMSGYTPSGQYYSDPGVPWVNYFYRGCAIHGFVRQSYGYSQSLGCVELPVSKAKVAWTLMHYGTLVTVGK
jgi:peptidoglycan hydrolase-like protein with peptidoglycan-binding domain